MPSYDYLSFIKKILKNGELLSGNITDELSKKYGITKTYGRKLLSKYVSEKEIYSSYPLLFLNGGQCGYSLNSGNNQYVALLPNKPRLQNVYYIFIRTGFISQFELLKITGVINDENTKYYDLGKVINDLKYFFPYLKVRIYEGTVFYHNDISESEFERQYNEKLKNRLFEVKFLPSVLHYAQNINLISKKPHYISKESPFKGIEIRQKLVFDATAFTGIGNPNKESTVAVFDVKINERYMDEDYQGFKYRVDTLINSTKGFNQRVIPIVVVNEIDFIAEVQIKDDNKMIYFKLSQIYGSRINEFLKLVNQQNYGSLNAAIQTLELIESLGFAQQLVQFFPFIFESLVGEILNKILIAHGYNFQFKRNELIHHNGKYKEYDVWFENDDSVLIVECKFHKKNLIKWESYDKNGKIDNDCAKYFFEDKYDFVISSGIAKSIKMIMIAANGFHETSINEISQISIDKKHDSFPLALSGEELLELCNNQNISVKEYKKWFEEYFIRKTD